MDSVQNLFDLWWVVWSFNKGDHKGSFEIYKQTAEKILQQCSVRRIQQKLHVALDSAAKQSSFTERAWILRHAFDAIVDGGTDTSNSSYSELEETSPPMNTNRKNMMYKEACLELAAAIVVGVLTETTDEDSDEPSVKD